MRSRRLRITASTLIVIITVILFVHYLQTHPSYIPQLRKTGIWWVTVILAADIAAITALSFLYRILAEMTGKELGIVENWLLTIYSSIANFFGPLQSGPGVRAAYLKAKHQVSLRSYFLATLMAYGTFAVISAFALLVGMRPWWQTLIVCVGACLISYFVITFVRRRKVSTTLILTPRLIAGLVGYTLLQTVFLTLRYYAALEAAGAHVSFGQAVSYTGAANFSVFVALTPDGIGIREAFLLFSQNIHHVSTHAIIAANIVDRATFIVFLGSLFLIAISLHAKQRFSIRKQSQSKT